METENNTPIPTPAVAPTPAPIYPAGMPVINPANNNNINVVVTAPTAAPMQPNPIFPPADPSLRYRSKAIYVLLALLFGPLGVHKFYFGYNSAGVWMLVLFVLSGTFLSPFLYIWAIISCFTTEAPKGYYKYGSAYIPKGMNS